MQFLLLVAFHLIYMLFLRIVFLINFIWWSSIKKLITMTLVMDWFWWMGGSGGGSHLKILLRDPVLLRAAMLTAAMLTGQISCWKKGWSKSLIYTFVSYFVSGEVLLRRNVTIIAWKARSQSIDWGKKKNPSRLCSTSLEPIYFWQTHSHRCCSVGIKTC